MKVVAFNGSPRKGGNTEICLNLIGEELSKKGIELEIIQVADEKTPDGASENVERQIREKEGQRILAQIKDGAYVEMK